MSYSCFLAFSALGLVVFTWLVFPATVISLAAWRGVSEPPPLDVGADAPTVSVIFATRDPIEVILRRVENLRDLDYPAERLEIVVALDHSNASDRDAVSSLLPADVRLVVGDAPSGKPGALNAGVRAATADILVFADARQHFDPRVLRTLVPHLADPSIGAVSGTVVRPHDCESTLVRHYTEFDQRLRHASGRLIASMGVMGAIYAMRRRDWLPLPPDLILDDLYVPMRLVLAGYRVTADLRAVAFETRTTDARQEASRKVRTLTGVYQVVALLPDLLLPWRNRGWVLFCGIKLLRLLTPWALALAAAAGAIGMAEVSPSSVQWLLSGAALAAAVLVIVPGRITARLRSLIRQFAYLQYATAMATVNGVRQRWDVWH